MEAGLEEKGKLATVSVDYAMRPGISPENARMQKNKALQSLSKGKGKEGFNNNAQRPVRRGNRYAPATETGRDRSRSRR